VAQVTQCVSQHRLSPVPQPRFSHGCGL
jgi:hypothetical protein